MKTSLFLLVVVLIGCRPREQNQETHPRRTVSRSSESETTAVPAHSSPPLVDTLQVFVDQFPEKVAQQIAFTQEHYAQTIARKEQLDRYELFRRKGTNDFILVPKDSAKHVYGEEPYDLSVYYYQSDSLEADSPEIIFYFDASHIVLVEESLYDPAEGSFFERKEYYFSEAKPVFVFHRREFVDYWYDDTREAENSITQYRYYFLGNYPIRCLKKEYRGPDDIHETIAHQPNKTIPLQEGQSILHETQTLLDFVDTIIR